MFDRSKPLAWLCASALVIVPAAIAGCGGSDDNSDSSSSTAASTGTTASGGGGAASGTIDVSETDFALSPSNPTVQAGTVTVNATNDGQTQHAIEVEGPNGEAQSDPIDPGGKASVTVDLSKPGTYEWYCPIANHKELGMKGEITVK